MNQYTIYFTPERTLSKEVIAQQEIDKQNENYDAWHEFWFRSYLPNR